MVVRLLSPGLRRRTPPTPPGLRHLATPTAGGAGARHKAAGYRVRGDLMGCRE